MKKDEVEKISCKSHIERKLHKFILSVYMSVKQVASGVVNFSESS